MLSATGTSFSYLSKQVLCHCARLAVYFNIFTLPFFGPVFFGLVYQVFKQWQEKIVSGIHE